MHLLSLFVEDFSPTKLVFTITTIVPKTILAEPDARGCGRRHDDVLMASAGPLGVVNNQRTILHLTHC